MKRFTETEKWEDPWFRKLPGAHKLVFIFLTESCNNAGFYEFDVDHVAYLTALKKEHVEGAMKGLTRGIREADGWVWIRNFLRHQKNEPLNPENPAHRNIIGLLRVQQERFKKTEGFADFVGPYKGLLSPIGIGEGKGEVQVIRKESPERKPKPSVDIPPDLDTPEFRAAWQGYLEYRRAAKLKPLPPVSVQSRFKEFSAWGVATSIAAIERAIANGTQGIFHPGGNGQRPNGAHRSGAIGPTHETDHGPL